MKFLLSSKIAPNLRFVAETGSTNTDLVQDSAALGDFSVLVAGYQSAGRGRSGREWLAPEGSSLFVSVLLKPKGIAVANFSWLPLMSGLAMSKTVTELLGEVSPSAAAKVGLKWPNDVLVGENKISGVLSELLPTQDGVVVGAGLNVLQSKSDLPIEKATSLKLEGAVTVDLDAILFIYLQNLRSLYSMWVSALGDANLSGLRSEVIANCITLSQSEVRVILPSRNYEGHSEIHPGTGGDPREMQGVALGIDETGRLLVRPTNSSESVAVAAGDIVHLRHN